LELFQVLAANPQFLLLFEGPVNVETAGIQKGTFYILVQAACTLSIFVIEKS
jgi:hypothetical protein